MGLSMLLLLARTCVELNRMAEVRAQMEALLKEIRDEAGRVKQAGALATPRTFHLQMSSTTTVSSSSCTSDTDTNHHHHQAATDELTRHRECESKPVLDEDDERVDLETAAEFEAESTQQLATLACNTEQQNSDEVQ